MFKKSAFTLLEVLVVSVIVSMILVIVITLYSKMIRIKLDVDSRKTLVHGSYSIMEKLNILMKDYTIDYEEYFNRRIVWCDNNFWDTFSWDVWSWVNNWYCDRFTHFWNDNLLNYSLPVGNWSTYSCSSQVSENSPSNVYQNWNVSNWSWCWFWAWGQLTQWFWTYKNQFWDVRWDTDWTWWIVWDDDDQDLAKWPVSIMDAENVKELYLISKDNTQRLLIRRAMIDSWDWDGNWTIDSDVDKLYTLQMLRLRWFDAWLNHDFSNPSEWLLDWKIDTWACDYSMWFKCNWINTKYWWTDNYRVPNEQDYMNSWVNILGNDVSVKDIKFMISPVSDYSHAYFQDEMQLNPFIKISFTTKLYGEPRAWKINPWVLNTYQLDLQTTFNIKTHY